MRPWSEETLQCMSRKGIKKAVAAERSAKQETQLLQQPANAAELQGAMLTQPIAGQTATVSFLAALIHVVFDTPQVCSSICMFMAYIILLGILSRDTNLTSTTGAAGCCSNCCDFEHLLSSIIAL